MSLGREEHGQSTRKIVIMGSMDRVIFSQTSSKPHYRIAFVGGGSGGHIYPGIAVMHQIVERFQDDGGGVDCFWIMGKSRVDYAVVGEQQLRAYHVTSGKLRRYLSFQNLLDIFKVCSSVLNSLRILKRERPDVIFSKGGYVSVGPVVAAALLRIPVFMHDSDLDPGLATRLTACFARRIFVPYPESIQHYPVRFRDRLTVSGNPVRSMVLSGDARAFRDTHGIDGDLPVLLVMGGSQGASWINTFIRDFRNRLTPHCVIVHQCGSVSRSEVSSSDGMEEEPNDRYIPYSYLDTDLPDALACADLILSRAGAGAIWEAALTGTPMILVPIGTAGSRGDQSRNAEFFASQGGALLHIEEKDATESLFDAIIRLLRNEQERVVLSDSARSLCVDTADSFIADCIFGQVLRCEEPGGGSCPSKYSTSSHS